MSEQVTIPATLRVARWWLLMPWAFAPAWLAERRWYQAFWWRAAGCVLELD